MNQYNQTRKILVVDDDPVIRDMMADILEFEGYSISVARNGSEALQLLRSDEDFLVFLDIMMPVMSGKELCALIEADPHLRERHTNHFDVRNGQPRRGCYTRGRCNFAEAVCSG